MLKFPTTNPIAKMIPGNFLLKIRSAGLFGSIRKVEKLCFLFSIYLCTVFTLLGSALCFFLLCVFSAAAAEQTAYELECMKIFALAAYFVCSGKPLIVSSFYLGPPCVFCVHLKLD